jgi:site-specific recombinase XerD
LTTAIHEGKTTNPSVYDNFVNALRSPETKRVYVNSLKRYMRHVKLTSPDQLFHDRITPKVIEAHLIDYVMSLRQDGIAYATIQHLMAPVFTFYQLNDVIVNRKKVHRYLGERKRVVKDKAYTIEQIGQALQNADQRMRMIILILASTGCRIGALPGLTLGNLTKLPDVGLYKITFYEGTNNEYYSFCTRECASTGIENYLNYRQRCGEKLAFNQSTNSWEPADTPLIRLSFDATDSFQASRQVKKIGYQGLKRSINLHLIRSGLRQVEHPTEHYKRVRKSITLTNGFRKHVISTFIEAGLNHEIRELLVDHATGLDQSYFRPSERQVLEEYLKAEPLLTIDSSLRLKQEVQSLRVEKNSWEAMRKELDDIKKILSG